MAIHQNISPLFSRTHQDLYGTDHYGHGTDICPRCGCNSLKKTDEFQVWSGKLLYLWTCTNPTYGFNSPCIRLWRDEDYLR